MKVTPKEPRLERRRLADLHPYPRQADFFEDIPRHDLEGLARGHLKGQVPPIHVLPAGNKAGLPPDTIVDGHMRAKAHALNGTTEADVLMRFDLLTADLLAIEHEFLCVNKHRRHQDVLGRARLALRMFEIEKGRRGKLSDAQKGEARDRVGEEVGLSGRHLQRLWRILHAPLEVQNAVRSGRLPIVVAERVAGFGRETQAEIARRIQTGENPREVVNAYLPAAEDRKWGGGDAVVGVLRALRSLLRCARGPQDHFRRERLASHIAFFEEAQEVLADLIARATLGADQVQKVHAKGGEEE